MPRKDIGLHDDAFAEARAAYDWYATQDPTAAEAFIDELDAAMERIVAFPTVGAPYSSGTRR